MLAPGGEEVAKAYGRKLRPLLSTLGVTGKAGEVVKVPTGGALTSPLLVLVGLGKEADPPGASAGPRARPRGRSPTPPASRSRCPADARSWCGRSTEGWILGGYRFTSYKNDAKQDDDAPGEVLLLTGQARKSAVVTAFEQAQVVAARRRRHPRLGEHPARRPAPRRSSPTRSPPRPRSSPRAGAHPRSASACSTRPSWPSSAAAASSGSAAAPTAPPRLVELTYAPEGRDRRTSRWSARASPSTPAA